MKPYLAVSPEDFDGLSAILGTTSGLVPAVIAELGAEVCLEGQALRADQTHAGLVAIIQLSSAARAQVQAFAQAFGKQFGRVPPLLDLSGQDPADWAQHLAGNLVGLLVAQQQDQAKRNVTLMRDLASMRQAQSQLQEAFSRLETHVQRHALLGRHPSLTLSPSAQTQPLVLAPGAQIDQRLPQSSEGLCDLGLWLAQIPEGPGQLDIELRTAGDAALRGQWRLSAAMLQPGWLRLSLPVALEAGAQTALLRLRWSGEGDLQLGQAMRHPDPRYQLQRSMGGLSPAAAEGGRVLALKLWSYVPGCAPPAVTDGIYPSDLPQQRLLISSERLASAVNLRTAHLPFLYLPDNEALLVHVHTAGPSLALLRGGVPKGARHLSAKIMTRAEAGPQIEYAFAVLPMQPGAGPEPDQPLPVIAAEYHSEWQRLPAMLEGELHLPLPEALAADHDLYLMTRLPPGAEDPSWGWATFSGLAVVLA